MLKDNIQRKTACSISVLLNLTALY